MTKSLDKAHLGTQDIAPSSGGSSGGVSQLGEFFQCLHMTAVIFTSIDIPLSMVAVLTYYMQCLVV